MRAWKADRVPSNLPRVPVARLEGHDGPIQAVSFAGRLGGWLVCLRSL